MTTQELMLLNMALNAGMWVIGWFLIRRRASEEELKTVAERVARLEERVEALPTAAELTQVGIRVAELKGSIDTASAKLDATNSNVQLIHQWMMRNQ